MVVSSAGEEQKRGWKIIKELTTRVTTRCSTLVWARWGGQQRKDAPLLV